jgi:hypothetical protein
MKNADVQSWFGPDRKARRRLIGKLQKYVSVADATKEAMEKPHNPGIVHTSLVNEMRYIDNRLAEDHTREISETLYGRIP